MAIEQSVARHYTHGSLQAAIFDAQKASGKDIDRLAPGDLTAVDEFHIGGRQATVDFATQLGVRPGLHLLDIGCGLGGASRYFAHERGCRVTGVDLTEEYVCTAEALSERVGLGAPSFLSAGQRPRSAFRSGVIRWCPHAPRGHEHRR